MRLLLIAAQLEKLLPFSFIRLIKDHHLITNRRPLLDILGCLLIFFSSVLLGIWAVKGTIALRNVLLCIEALISIFYSISFFKENIQRIPLKNWIPFIFLGLIFFWVIFHYFFLAFFPEEQLNELVSTWLRSFLAVIVGVGTGIAIIKRPNSVNFLWLGILLSFLYLFCQYIPKAIALDTLFVHDYPSYIFYGKISGVLAGTILVVGLLGTMIDTIMREGSWAIFKAIVLWLLGTSVVLYSYVFIFDARNGVGLAAVLFSLFSIFTIFQFTKRGLSGRIGLNVAPILIIFILCATMFGWLLMQHTKHNPGWSTMWQDSVIAFQVEKYPNWQNPGKMGYPRSIAGETVKANTYERIAWATSGLTILLPDNPLGIGILNNTFGVALREKFPNSAESITGSHSAWIDISLAFGYPCLIFFLGGLLSIFCISVSNKGPHQYLTSLLSFGVLFLYTVGELSSQHSIEILCFLLALMSSLLLTSIQDKPMKSNY